MCSDSKESYWTREATLCIVTVHRSTLSVSCSASRNCRRAGDGGQETWEQGTGSKERGRRGRGKGQGRRGRGGRGGQRRGGGGDTLHRNMLNIFCYIN